jgi:hypothetical protein
MTHNLARFSRRAFATDMAMAPAADSARLTGFLSHHPPFYHQGGTLGPALHKLLGTAPLCARFVGGLFGVVSRARSSHPAF